MTTRVVTRRHRNGRNSEATVDELVRLWLCQRIGEVRQQRDDALRTVGDHPDPLQFVLDQFESCARDSAEVLEQSRELLVKMIDDTVNEMKHQFGPRSEQARESIRRLMPASAPIPVEGDPSRDSQPLIDLARSVPRCSTCQRGLEESRASVYSRCGCCAPAVPMNTSALVDRDRCVFVASLSPASYALTGCKGRPDRKAVAMYFAGIA
ncbi:hypothetical protein F4803DRAFT_557351 [Xylaria telfairii]|nr:hypothetical protein F4803DRAFT_557351 [Xylaria telfairii]